MAHHVLHMNFDRTDETSQSGPSFPESGPPLDDVARSERESENAAKRYRFDVRS